MQSTLPGVLRPIAVLVAALAFAACGSDGIDTPTTPDPVTAAAKGGNDKGGGPPGGGDGDGSGLPTITGAELPNVDPGDVTLYYAARTDAGGDELVGKIQDYCGFIYDIASGNMECLVDNTLVDDGDMYGMSMNPTGRVAGHGRTLADGSARVLILDPPYGPGDHRFIQPADFPAPVAHPDLDWTAIRGPVNGRGLNASGQVVVRLEVADPAGSAIEVERGLAVVTVSGDRSTVDVAVAPGMSEYSYVMPHGIADDGSVVFVVNGGSERDFADLYWTGDEGDAPMPLGGSEGSRGADVWGVTDQNVIYGLRDGRPVVWSDPTQAPEAVADLDLIRVWHDAAGNLLGEARGKGRNPSRIYCIGPSGVTELLTPSGFDRAQARTGLGDRIFGMGWVETGESFPAARPVFWDVGEAAGSGGC